MPKRLNPKELAAGAFARRSKTQLDFLVPIRKVPTQQDLAKSAPQPRPEVRVDRRGWVPGVPSMRATPSWKRTLGRCVEGLVSRLLRRLGC